MSTAEYPAIISSNLPLPIFNYLQVDGLGFTRNGLGLNLMPSFKLVKPPLQCLEISQPQILRFILSQSAEHRSRHHHTSLSTLTKEL